ncbi:Nucleoside-diphosphatase mig-23 [Hordeum vulgare]|nr:Nucleoside-diphosphatase mig-23 [Hordeum vulgare]
MRVSPGLSSFAADTARATESLRPLMEFAKEKVGGEGAAAATEVRLMATVGLRLLEEGVREAILVSCRNALRASGFRFEDSWAKHRPFGLVYVMQIRGKGPDVGLGLERRDYPGQMSETNVDTAAPTLYIHVARNFSWWLTVMAWRGREELWCRAQSCIEILMVRCKVRFRVMDSIFRFVWILMLNGADLKVCSSWDEDDEEALRWAALEKLPTYDRARTTVLAMPEGELKEVNADKLGAQQRIASVGDDHECFLSKFKDRVDRETRGFAFVEFVDPYDASDAQYHLNRTLFFGREITVVVAAESRKRPDDMRNRARVRGLFW